MFIKNIIMTYGILLAILVIMLLTSLFRLHFIRNYPSLFLVAIFTLIATMTGVFLAFRLQTSREEQKELELFKNELASLLMETGRNQKTMKVMRIEFSQTSVSVKELSTDVAKYMIQNPRSYKFGGSEFFYALWEVINSHQETNNIVSFLQRRFETNQGKLTEANLWLIRKNIAVSIYRLRTLQTLLDFYSKNLNIQLKKSPMFDKIINNLTYAEEYEKTIEIADDRYPKLFELEIRVAEKEGNYICKIYKISHDMKQSEQVLKRQFESRDKTKAIELAESFIKENYKIKGKAK